MYESFCFSRAFLRIRKLKCEAAHQEQDVEEGETLENVGEAWLQVHLLLGEDKNTEDVP